MIRIILLTGFFLIIGCESEKSYPWLPTLDFKTDYEESGQRLMALDFGLKPLETSNSNEHVLLIGVHGGNSNGYEWIYPLKTIDNESTLTYFYRWDDGVCSSPSAKSLSDNIAILLKENPQLEQILLIGHSYGGMLVSSFAENWIQPLPIEVHTVAAPLAGIKVLNTKCHYQPPTFIAENVTFYEWRTQKKLDGVFNNLESDPQVIDLKGSEVTLLPDTYKGRRLGHNWSISFVADELQQKKLK